MFASFVSLESLLEFLLESFLASVSLACATTSASASLSLCSSSNKSCRLTFCISVSSSMVSFTIVLALASASVSSPMSTNLLFVFVVFDVASSLTPKLTPTSGCMVTVSLETDVFAFVFSFCFCFSISASLLFFFFSIFCCLSFNKAYLSRIGTLLYTFLLLSLRSSYISSNSLLFMFSINSFLILSSIFLSFNI